LELNLNPKPNEDQKKYSKNIKRIGYLFVIMIAEILAILTAFLWAIGGIYVRKALESSDTTSGTFFRIAVSLVIFLVLTFFFVPLDSFKSEAVIYHVIAGVLAGFIALKLRFMSIKKYGVSKTSTILPTEVLFSSIIAVLILGEVVTLTIVVGTILIVLGVAFLSYKRHKRGVWFDRKIIFPLLTAFFYGMSTTPSKIGIDITNSPILSLTIELSTALIVIILYMLLSKKKLSLNRQSFTYFLISAIFGSIASICLFYAFNIGNLVTVVPLYSTSPLFTLFLTYFLLSELEKITPKLIISAILVVLGSALII
jgi:uncharacterized membrane protein